MAVIDSVSAPPPHTFHIYPVFNHHFQQLRCNVAAAAPEPVHPEAATLCKDFSVFPILISVVKHHCSCVVQPLRPISAILKPARSATNHTKPLTFSNLIYFLITHCAVLRSCCVQAESPSSPPGASRRRRPSSWQLPSRRRRTSRRRRWRFSCRKRRAASAHCGASRAGRRWRWKTLTSAPSSR